jgi:hypothetical protein
MRRTTIGCLIGFVVILAIPVSLAGLEIGRVSNLCKGATAKAGNVHEAIDAVRNYHGPYVLPKFLSMLRQFELFQRDGFDKEEKGGWWVEEWKRSFGGHGYTVDFSLVAPPVEIRCDVFECGAVDPGSCLTLGAEFAYWPR